MVENGEVVFSLGMIAVICIPALIWRRMFHPGANEDQKWGRIMWKGMTDPKMGGYRGSKKWVDTTCYLVEHTNILLKNQF